MLNSVAAKSFTACLFLHAFLSIFYDLKLVLLHVSVIYLVIHYLSKGYSTSSIASAFTLSKNFLSILILDTQAHRRRLR